jgi:hypothetical protein
VILVAFAIAVFDKIARLIEIANAAVTDVLDKRRLIEQIKRKRGIVNRYLAQDQAFGFENLH